MANREHLEILAKGVGVWNAWRAEFDPTLFVNADLKGATLAGSNLRNADLRRADLREADLRGTNLTGARLNGVHLGEADLGEADLSGADLRGANLTGAQFIDARLSGAFLIDAELRFADLRRADLSDAILSGARLFRAALNDTELRRSTLVRADLTFADLRGADLGEADLTRADLSEADLTGANLTDASVVRADLSGVMLRGADLSRANLTGAEMIGGDMRDADFSGAILGGNLFVNVDFRAAIGLETVRQIGPSTLGLDTMYRSRGQIPESFLRGSGVPEHFIAYLRSLARNTAVGSCFISYSIENRAFADRLYADLQAEGVRCWLRPHDQKSSCNTHEQIDHAIRFCDKLLLILSSDSVKSEWVTSEITNARAKEKRQNRQVLFLVGLVPFDNIRSEKLFATDVGIDSERKIRGGYILDFSNWIDDRSYQRAFKWLTQVLNAG
jgi:uncharacterized protein YjbI with pentapeptide repeats